MLLHVEEYIGLNLILVLNSNISHCFHTHTVSFCALSFALSLSASCVFVCGLRRPRCWHVCPTLTHRQLKQCNMQLRYEHFWHSQGGREEGEHKGGKKERQATRGRAGNLGFSSKRMRRADLAGIFLADAKRSNSQWVTKSLLRLTRPHQQNDGRL